MTTPGLTRPVTDTQRRSGLVSIDGRGFYAVPDVDAMAPFLMSVVSDGDRWMFISSTGALTCGRGDATAALFPYETDDRLHAAAGRVGPVTSLRVSTGTEVTSWRPFRGRTDGITRTIYKAVIGNSVVFEEVAPDLGLRLRYRWESSDRFGFVRTVELDSMRHDAVAVDVIDGLLGVLPHGLAPAFYQRMSNLSNAYKRSELIDPATRLALFSLEALVTDQAEPAESLRASAVWTSGFEGAAVSLDERAVAGFDAGDGADPSTILTGRRGAYLLSGSFELAPGARRTWRIVGDVALDQVRVAGLQHTLATTGDLDAALEASVDEASEALVSVMAPSDALQRTGDAVAGAHHFANVTYNVMRGGAPINGYLVDVDDLAAFLADRNRLVADRHSAWLAALERPLHHDALVEAAIATGDVDLIRLAHEYLPFGFSRRHGDPSRPWNQFSIKVRDDQGQPLLNYEGNWRDIFQNWEALCLSFPNYLPSVISVFVSGSTVDGFNPYRLTRGGIDWEVPDPEDPWSNIGYWGDHQIVYLLRLLEAAERYLPGAVQARLDRPWFAYADVPYRIANYDALLADPKSTITFDLAAERATEGRVEDVGSDGKLLWTDDGVHHVTLLEKLIVPALAKLSNFVPGGGIWMNTQRPEWNDANNALVGHGLSMVTLAHLRRYLTHLDSILGDAGPTSVPVSTEVVNWLSHVAEILADVPPEVTASPTDRRAAVDRLGRAFGDYRARVCGRGFTGTTPLEVDTVRRLCTVAIGRLDATLDANRRPDGLYHSYNLLHFGDGTASVEYLPEMLEGQVAVLSSGLLTPAQQADLVDALFTSDLYRSDQRSFMLYPARRLPGFLDKNVVPAADVAANPLLAASTAEGDGSLVSRDAAGTYRFNADLVNEGAVEATLETLRQDPAWQPLVEAHGDDVVALYEKVFNHHAYTGRSGSMYGYEGIGSIYWHMVAKLLVAVHDAVVEGRAGGADPDTMQRLVDAYRRVRSGLGFNKTAAEFGAIPIDPYSHTPAHAGAQQPGMTGLVKEELLTRLLELGVAVKRGELRVDPVLLRPGEFLDEAAAWPVIRVDGTETTLDLAAGSLGLTVCQVPVVVSTTTGPVAVEVTFADGRTERRDGTHVGDDVSAQIFGRTGTVARLDLYVPSID